MEDLLIPLFAIFFTLGVPVLAFATHFALRPLVRDVTQALGPRKQYRETIALLRERVAQLELEGRERDERLNELAEAELFRRQLEERAGGTTPAIPPPATPNPAAPGAPPPGP